MGNLILLLACLLSYGRHAIAQTEEPWLNPTWLNLYQYEKTLLGQFNSDINSTQYYFSPRGSHSPKAEFLAAINAFKDTSKEWGSLNLPAACAFPARKLMIEKLIGQKFHSPNCQSLEEWISKIDAKNVSLVFAGAYSGNPASVLGHTFLRFYGPDDKKTGQSLLSYSVGFLAVPDPNDSSLMYMAKGLFGGYPGFYQIEPHYMKVGLYNNSESRDLWEWRLNFSEEEVDLLIRHIWELHFNAHAPYYFVDENCSHRLIKALSVIQPIKGLGNIVIPGETVRLANQSEVLSNEIQFRPSIQRRMDYQIHFMSETQKHQFREASKDLTQLKNTKDPLVLDALIDYWTHQNFKEKTNLPPQKSALMEKTLLIRSRIKSRPQLDIKNNNIKSHYNLKPIIESHKARSLSLFFDPQFPFKNHAFSFYTGLHPSWMLGDGYDNVHQVEYLGIDYQKLHRQNPKQKKNEKWQATLVRIKGLSPLNASEKKWSWGIEVSSNNSCLLCNRYDDEPVLNITGLGGGALLMERNGLYLLPQLQAKFWSQQGGHADLPAGLLLGAVTEHGQSKLVIESEFLWNKLRGRSSIEINFSTALKKGLILRANYHHIWLDSLSAERIAQLGLSLFF